MQYRGLSQEGGMQYRGLSQAGGGGVIEQS